MRQPSHADIILAQGLSDTVRAGLVSMSYMGGQDPPLAYGVACSFPRTVSGNLIVDTADARHWCHPQRFACAIWFQWEEVLQDDIPRHQMENGHSFVILSRDAHPTDLQGVLGDQDDDTSLMARRVRPRDLAYDASPHSSTSSSSSSAPQWQDTVIFRLDGRSAAESLPWHDQALLRQQAGEAFGLQPDEVLCVQLVVHRPPDFIQADLQGIILQSHLEPRPSPFERIVLLDFEVAVNEIASTVPFRRLARWLPYVLNRRSLLRLLGCELVCQNNPAICHVRRNNAIVDSDGDTIMHIQDGDYIKVHVGDLEESEPASSSSCTSSASLHTVDFMDSDAPLDAQDDPDDSALFQLAVSEFVHTCRSIEAGFGPVTAKTDPEAYTDLVSTASIKSRCASTSPSTSHFPSWRSGAASIPFSTSFVVGVRRGRSGCLS